MAIDTDRRSIRIFLTKVSEGKSIFEWLCKLPDKPLNPGSVNRRIYPPNSISARTSSIKRPGQSNSAVLPRSKHHG
jgi:hypothetical protein